MTTVSYPTQERLSISNAKMWRRLARSFDAQSRTNSSICKLNDVINPSEYQLLLTITTMLAKFSAKALSIALFTKQAVGQLTNLRQHKKDVIYKMDHFRSLPASFRTMKSSTVPPMPMPTRSYSKTPMSLSYSRKRSLSTMASFIQRTPQRRQVHWLI